MTGTFTASMNSWSTIATSRTKTLSAPYSCTCLAYSAVMRGYALTGRPFPSLIYL